MTEANSNSASGPQKATQFDDRIDTETRIGNLEAIRLLGRAVGLLGSAKGLFSAKLGLATLALIPGLFAPWLPKIVIDQVLLQRPFDETEVPFPPHVAPFVDMIRDLGPMEIMASVVAFYLALLLVFGRGEIEAGFAEGSDSATQSENRLNGGGSAVSGLVGMCDTLVHIRLSQRLSNRLRTTLFERMARLPMTTLDDHRCGDAVYRVMYDAPMVPGVTHQAIIEPIFSIAGAAMSLYLMSYSYGSAVPELVWTAAAMIPATLAVTLPFSGLMRRVSQDSRAAGSATTNAIEESFGNIAAVQSLGGMAREKARIEGQSKESFRRFRLAMLVEIVVGIVAFAAIVAGVLYSVVLITDHIIDGVMSPGDFSVLFSMVFSLAVTAMVIGYLWIELQQNVAALRRVFFFIDLPSEDTGTSLPALGEVKRDVRIEGVDFQYPAGVQALKNINLELKLNELVAIVGPTGAGKTSLAYLIPGFLRPTRGRVLIDGQDIAEVDVDSLRDQVAYVFQEHLLLSESIRDNLLLVNPKATEADMLDACRKAGAEDFVEALPEGLDTVLGRAGDTLSVGQKQRLCIARGLIRDTKILILDEPTAALDPKTEKVLVRALHQAAKDRLVIVIAHRLSTIRRADRIIFLEDGEVKDMGDHDALMANPDGPYRRFVELQGG